MMRFAITDLRCTMLMCSFQQETHIWKLVDMTGVHVALHHLVVMWRTACKILKVVLVWRNASPRVGYKVSVLITGCVMLGSVGCRKFNPNRRGDFILSNFSCENSATLWEWCSGNYSHSVSTVIDWLPVQGDLHLLPTACWDRWQPAVIGQWRTGFTKTGWMDTSQNAVKILKSTRAQIFFFLLVFFTFYSVETAANIFPNMSRSDHTHKVIVFSS